MQKPNFSTTGASPKSAVGLIRGSYRATSLFGKLMEALNSGKAGGIYEAAEWPNITGPCALPSRLFVMRNANGAAADELANDGIAGKKLRSTNLLEVQTGDGFQQRPDALVPDPGIQETAVGLEFFRSG